MSRKIPDNIRPILESAAEYIGRYEREWALEELDCALSSGHIESPIEMALYVAFHAVARVNFISMSDAHFDRNGQVYAAGLWIETQSKIGPYRADFFVTYHERKPSSEPTKIVVECDGTAFHERTEPERRKEKMRDRFMQMEGYKVFRYTGKEILQDPYRVAAEVIQAALGPGQSIVTPQEYFEDAE